MGSVTWGEMKSVLAEKYGVEEKKIAIEAPAGKEVIVYLERVEAGKKVLHTLPILLEDDEMMSPGVIRNICDSLKVSKKDFGFTMG